MPRFNSNFRCYLSAKISLISLIRVLLGVYTRTLMTQIERINTDLIACRIFNVWSLKLNLTTHAWIQIP